MIILKGLAVTKEIGVIKDIIRYPVKSMAGGLLINANCQN